MATDMKAFARELKGFSDRKEILRSVRAGIRKPFPAVRARIRQAALGTMPARGGLNRWVAAIRVTLSIKTGARTAGVIVKGGRNSTRGRSDMRAIDRGRVRAPSWGRRGPGNWHTVMVKPGFFTDTVADSPEWLAEIDVAVDAATRKIRGV